MTRDKKLLIDEEIRNLDEKDRNRYKIYKRKNFKSENKLFLITAFFYSFAVPVFYMNFKEIKLHEYLINITCLILIYPVLVLVSMLLFINVFTFILAMLILFLYIALVIWNFVIKATLLSDVKNRVENYNYEKKRLFLVSLIKRDEMRRSNEKF